MPTKAAYGTVLDWPMLQHLLGLSTKRQDQRTLLFSFGFASHPNDEPLVFACWQSGPDRFCGIRHGNNPKFRIINSYDELYDTWVDNYFAITAKIANAYITMGSDAALPTVVSATTVAANDVVLAYERLLELITLDLNYSAAIAKEKAKDNEHEEA